MNVNKTTLINLKYMKPLYTTHEIFNLVAISDSYDDLLNIIEVLKFEYRKYSLAEYAAIMVLIDMKTDKIFLSELN